MFVNVVVVLLLASVALGSCKSRSRMLVNVVVVL